MSTTAALACVIERARIAEAVATGDDDAARLIGWHVDAVLVRLGVRA